MRYSLKKSDLLALCKDIASRYDGCEFSAGKFKLKKMKHSDVVLELFLTYSPGSATIDPCTGIINKKIKKLSKEILGYQTRLTSFIRHIDFDKNLDLHSWRFHNVEDGHTEQVLLKTIDTAFLILDKYYHYNDEESLLRNLPLNYEEVPGVYYCLARAILGDYDFIRDYRMDKIETIRPKRYDDIDKIMDYYGIVL